jgi:aspartate/methionine/tyrosine aminotransferase
MPAGALPRRADPPQNGGTRIREFGLETCQDGSGSTPSIVDLSPRGIAVGSMSKAFSPAGLRLGWIAAPPAVIRAVTVHRDYNTISVGMVDDLLAVLGIARGRAGHEPVWRTALQAMAIAGAAALASVLIGRFVTR